MPVKIHLLILGHDFLCFFLGLLECRRKLRSMVRINGLFHPYILAIYKYLNNKLLLISINLKPLKPACPLPKKKGTFLGFPGRL